MFQEVDFASVVQMPLHVAIHGLVVWPRTRVGTQTIRFGAKYAMILWIMLVSIGSYTLVIVSIEACYPRVYKIADIYTFMVLGTRIGVVVVAIEFDSSRRVEILES